MFLLVLRNTATSNERGDSSNASISTKGKSGHACDYFSKLSNDKSHMKCEISSKNCEGPCRSVIA